MFGIFDISSSGSTSSGSSAFMESISSKFFSSSSGAKSVKQYGQNLKLESTSFPHSEHTFIFYSPKQALTLFFICLLYIKLQEKYILFLKLFFYKN